MASALDEVFAYKPLPTPLLFHQDYKDTFVRAIEGPFGSGKSVACVQELLYIAMRQKPAPDKKRYTRFAIMRESYPLLLATTKKTLEMWLPNSCGSIKETVPLSGLYEIPLPDGTTVHMELLLLSMSKPEHAKKLRSTDFTAVWINEATEIWAKILTTAIERVGRYPSNQFGVCTWWGVIMDYNKPPIGHWLHDMFDGDNTPEGYKKYVQPPAAFKIESADGVFDYKVNEEAENLENHAAGVKYYTNQIESKKLLGDFAGIDRELCLLDVDEKVGMPVWPLFNRDIHVAKTSLNPVSGLEVVLAIDTSGIHPAAIVTQFTGKHWAVFDEIYGDATGFEEFVHSGLMPLLKTKYSQAPKVVAVCDPANARDAMRMLTPVSVLQDAGIYAQVAFTNDPKTRIEAVNLLWNRNVGGIIIDPKCDMLINACAGGYRYKRLNLSGTVGSAYSVTPEKNEASHIADALQYLGLYAMKTREDSNSINTSQIKAAFKERLRVMRGR